MNRRKEHREKRKAIATNARKAGDAVITAAVKRGSRGRKSKHPGAESLHVTSVAPSDFA
jgi:hypothetical protein